MAKILLGIMLMISFFSSAQEEKKDTINEKPTKTSEKFDDEMATETFSEFDDDGKFY